MTVSSWLAASEIASARLPGLPTSRSKAKDFIARIRADRPDLVRPRAGRGGGYEVSADALPDVARSEIVARAQKTALTDPAAPSQELIDAHEADKRQMASRGTGDLTAHQREVMEARAAVLMAIDARCLASGLGRRPTVLSFLQAVADGQLDPAEMDMVCKANDRRGDVRTLARSTIYAWFAVRADRGIIALAPGQRAKEALPAWFDDFLRLYAKPSKPSIAEALRDFNRSVAPGTAQPTEAQVRRCLAKMPELERMKGRVGKLAMRTRLAYTARDFEDLLPTSVYVADGKTFDAEVSHPIHGGPFRPELTTIIDAGTRRVVGWSAALDENTFGVVDALRRACAGAGVPAIFYTDRGPGYRNKAMDAPLTGFMARAGITPMRALPYNSQAKGVVERLNQIYTGAAKRLPTYIGRDMDKEAKLLVFKTTRRDLAITGTSRLLPGWDAFLEHVEAEIADYNGRPHSGLPRIRDPQIARTRHMTPNEMWAAKVEGFEPIIPDQAELDDMFRPYVLRRTRRALVEWLGNSYFAPALEPLDGQDVVIGYDIRDASRVWVRTIEEIDGERVPGRLIAVATFEGHKTRYVPVSYEQAAMEKRHQARRARLERKIDAVDRELSPAAILDMRPAAPMPTLADRDGALVNVGAVELAASPEPVQKIVSINGRPLFPDDVAFARWVAENPSRVTEVDREYLRDLILTHSTNELLRMSGLDLVRLRSIARNELDHPERAERSA
ncbi:Mu transposase C-terminal domain-containing protein [Phreatobacter stygius]|uniref:Transposase n=1 Tax=Phreatobacter stygius TaxID=1940610 RepID=A0A4D7B3Q0_9HYPH|nr:Mu transposase C-terminal domain-containing protein [Phreatobacter stygius]QCI65663.1 hypothetical protein E8M01_16475 [Phreatobacter stygius]